MLVQNSIIELRKNLRLRSIIFAKLISESVRRVKKNGTHDDYPLSDLVGVISSPSVRQEVVPKTSRNQ